MKKATVTRRLRLIALVLATMVGAGFALTQHLQASGDRCWQTGDCSCFSDSYCTDWPIGDSCEYSWECDEA